MFYRYWPLQEHQIGKRGSCIILISKFNGEGQTDLLYHHLNWFRMHTSTLHANVQAVGGETNEINLYRRLGKFSLFPALRMRVINCSNVFFQPFILILMGEL